MDLRAGQEEAVYASVLEVLYMMQSARSQEPPSIIVLSDNEEEQVRTHGLLKIPRTVGPPSVDSLEVTLRGGVGWYIFSRVLEGCSLESSV